MMSTRPRFFRATVEAITGGSADSPDLPSGAAGSPVLLNAAKGLCPKPG